MYSNTRTEPMQLKALKALKRRLPPNHLSLNKIEEKISILESGFHGENFFDQFTSHVLSPRCLNLRNITLPAFSETIQIDSLFITPSFILICEIKNIKGNLHFDKKGGSLSRVVNGKEEYFSCPVTQVERHKEGIEVLLKNLNVKIPVIEMVVFTNSQVKFTVRSDEQSIYNQITRIESVTRKMRELKLLYRVQVLDQKGVKELWTKIMNKSLTPYWKDVRSPYSIEENELIRGVLCIKCDKGTVLNYGKWCCQSCGHSNKENFLESVTDYFLLIKDSCSIKDLRNFLDIDSSRKALEWMYKFNFQSKEGSRPSVFFSPMYVKKT
ncbi:nuclease-related domain-containing protein [Jeotgalibacillus salarius]|nr:nuclease-related domain-containing protein [Jeotgalibacillus salarius]